MVGLVKKTKQTKKQCSIRDTDCRDSCVNHKDAMGTFCFLSLPSHVKLTRGAGDKVIQWIETLPFTAVWGIYFLFF